MNANGPEIHEATVPETTLLRYVGTYDYMDDGKKHTGVITNSGGALYWNQDGAGAQRLLPFSERTFSLSGTVVEFVPQEGPVTHLLMQWAEGEIKAVRRK